MSIAIKPHIITDGLILYLDAKNIRSFSSDSSVFKSLIGNYTERRYGTVLYNGLSVDYNSGAGAIIKNNLLKFGTSPFSISIMLYLDTSIGSWRTFPLSCWNTGAATGTNEWLIGSISNYPVDKYAFSICTSTSNIFDVRTNAKLLPNTWYNLVGTRDGSTLKIYVNGAFNNYNSNLGIANSIIDTSCNLYIGSIAGGTSDYSPSLSFNWIGDISYVQIYNKALTNSEVLQNYNALKSRYGF